MFQITRTPSVPTPYGGFKFQSMYSYLVFETKDEAHMVAHQWLLATGNRYNVEEVTITPEGFNEAMHDGFPRFLEGQVLAMENPDKTWPSYQ